MEQPEPYKLEQELNLLDPKSVKLYLNDFEDLILEIDGSAREVVPFRAFPLTGVDQFIALRNTDEEEIGMIRDMADLDADSRRALHAELERAYFTPRITQVNAVEENFHVPKWDVETDRGPRVFEIRSSRSDVRVMASGRILFRDADGNRYEIPDYRRLDPISRSLVETQV
ncbi:MAG: DUF1854 domain-containing protein [Candidatus Latescibacteria bacterium]|jgi:hypothetical protein|nr:DUF1854 domain-containing protein [Candidatus Latescibacterota bacterium]